MKRDRRAQIATILILAGAMMLVAAKRGGWRPPAIISAPKPATP